MKKIIISICILLIVVAFLTYFQLNTNSIDEKIISQDGYTLNVLSTSEVVNFDVDKKWIPHMGETNVLDKEIEKIENTTIYLKSIHNQDQSESVYINLELKQDNENKSNGKFLYTMSINEDRTFSTVKQEWNFYNKKKLIEISHGIGDGPGALINVHFDSEQLDKLDEIFTVEYKGFLMYEYSRK
jgi:hypothetical protein